MHLYLICAVSSSAIENSILVYFLLQIRVSHSACPLYATESSERWNFWLHFFKSSSTPDFKSHIMTRKVFYNYSSTGCKNIDTFIYLSEFLGFRHKFLIVQKLPKAVTIDWAQVLRIIKDIRDIVIQPSISGNHIKAESLSIRLITLLPVRPLVHLIFYHYWNSFFLGHSQFTNSCNYFQAPPAFHLFGAALCIPAV